MSALLPAASCLLVAATACSGDDEPSGSASPTGFALIERDNTTGSPTNPENPNVPPDEPRLIGQFLVTKTVEKIRPRTSESGRVGDRDQRLWDFQPSCENGACNGTITSTNPTTGEQVTARFSWDGTTYTFAAKASGPCGKDDNGGLATLRDSYRIVPEKTDDVNEITSFSGTETQVYRPADKSSRCPSGTNTLSLDGGRT